MKSLIQKIAFVALLVAPLSGAQSFAQDFSAGVDLTSKLVWRGLEMSPSPSVLPIVNFEAGDFSAYACGSYALDNSYQEFDLGLTYSLGSFTLELVDYFYPACKYDLNPDADWFNYFNYGETTGHQLDVILYYEPESIPFRAMLSVIPLGDDYLDDDSRAFSSYLELGWYHEMEGNRMIEANVGASLLHSNIYGTDGLGLVNCELKYSRSFDLGSVQLPLSASVIVNPYFKQSYLCASMGITF